MRNSKDQKDQPTNFMIEKLVAERRNLQGNIQDYYSSLTLNRKALDILVNDIEAQNPSNKSHLTSLLQGSMFSEMSQLRSNQESLQDELLMQQQIIDEELLFDTEVLNSHLQRIDDMRKLMHDKQYSYSNMVDKLNAYQQLGDEQVRVTTGSIDMIVKQKMNRQQVARMSGEKSTLASKIKACRAEKEMYKDKYKQMIQLIKQRAPYDKIIRALKQQDTDTKSENANVWNAPFEPKEIRNIKGLVANPKVDGRPIHKQLVKLLKKEYAATNMFREEISQSWDTRLQGQTFNQQLRKDQRYLDRQLGFYRKRLQKLEAVHKFYLVGEKVNQELRTMEFQKAEQSDSEQSVKESEEESLKISSKNIPMAMMVRSGSQPQIKC